MHRVLKIAQRLLASLHLLGQRKVQKMVVVESAEGAAERVEAIQKDPTEQEDRYDGNEQTPSEPFRCARTIVQGLGLA